MLVRTSNDSPTPAVELEKPVSSVSRVRRVFLLSLGGLSLGVGALGVIVPGLPTTIFVLAAVYLFAQSHPPLERWVREHRIFGPYLSLGRRGMPRRARITAIGVMWIAISISVVVLWSGGPLWPSVVVGLGVVGTVYLIFGLRAPAAVSADGDDSRD